MRARCAVPLEDALRANAVIRPSTMLSEPMITHRADVQPASLVLRPQRSQDGDRCRGEARCGGERDSAGHLSARGLRCGNTATPQQNDARALATINAGPTAR